MKGKLYFGVSLANCVGVVTNISLDFRTLVDKVLHYKSLWKMTFGGILGHVSAQIRWLAGRIGLTSCNYNTSGIGAAQPFATLI